MDSDLSLSIFVHEKDMEEATRILGDEVVIQWEYLISQQVGNLFTHDMAVTSYDTLQNTADII